MVGNTWFKQPNRRKWTWQQPGNGSKNQIDYILVSKRFRNALLTAKTLPRADCYSDHIPVAAIFRLKLKRNKQRVSNVKLDLATLKADLEIREKYRVAVKNRFQALEGMEEVEDQWEALKNAILVSATEIIPKVEKKTKQKWMTQEILDLMDERRKAKGEP